MENETKDIGFNISDEGMEYKFVGIFLTGRQEFLLQCSDMLEPEDFTNEWCSNVWKVYKAIIADRGSGDIINVANKAKQMGLKNINSISLVEASTDTNLLFAHPIEIASYLSDLSIRRKMLTTLLNNINDVREISIPVETILGDLKALIDKTATQSISDVKNVDVMKETIHHWEQRIRGEVENGMMTGFYYIDSRGGLQLSDLDIIAGRTSHGKTSLAIAIALNVAEQGNPVGIFSIEMSFEQLFTRMTSIRSGVSASRLQYSRLEQSDFEKAFVAASKIGELPIFYDGTRTSNINQIEISIRRMKLNHEIKLVVIDYAQLLSNPQAKDKRDIVGGAADALKRLAVELNICIILISQLRRVSNSESPVPSIAQLKESGNLENAADNIFLVYRAELHQATYPDLTQQWSRYDTAGTALIINGKSRNHSIGEFMLGFDGERTYYYELSTPPLRPEAQMFDPDKNHEPNTAPPF